MSSVLYVDDESVLCRAFARLFGSDLHVVTSSSAGQAVQLLGSQAFDVVVSDLRMDGMDGVELLSYAKNVQPRARRMLVSGYVDLDAIVAAVNRAGLDRVLLKPWNNQELHDAVRGACARAATHKEQERQVGSLRRKLEQLDSGSRAREALCDTRTTELLDAFLCGLDARDPGARARGRRLSRQARRLGLELGLRGEALTEVEHGALLAEIGKIALPDLILRAGGLDHQGWCELARHPLAGYRLLERVHFLEGARRVVLQHRERYDGTGFPSGLAGDQICIGARIYAAIALCDELVASMPEAEQAWRAAAWEIDRRAGTWLDPVVAAAWRRVPTDQWSRSTQPPLTDAPESFLDAESV